MGADIKKLRNRIKSVDSTLHLTKAMGLVASSKIRRATDSMNKARQYKSTFDEAIKSLTMCDECQKSPFMKKREGERIRLIVIAGDRGLAGGYNANIFRALRQFENVEIIPIGKRACDKFGKEAVSAEHFSSQMALELARSLCEEFKNEEYDKLGIVGTKYVSMLTQEPFVSWILPLERQEGEKSHGAIFEPDEQSILNLAIAEYISAVIMSCVRESFACEIASRRNAMDSAGKNAKQMIDELGLQYNRARQGAITQELTEIVAGSGAN